MMRALAKRNRVPSIDGQHSSGTFSVQDVDDHVPVGAPKGHIRRSASDGKPSQHDLVQKPRKNGLTKDNAACACVEGQACAGLDEKERGRSSPGLRDAGDGVEGRTASLLTREAAKKFGET